MSKLFVNTIAPNSGDTVTLSGSLVTTGKLTIGDASTDTVAFSAEISSSLIPDVDNTYDLGSINKEWRTIYVGELDGQNGRAGISASAHLVPKFDNTYDLGSSGKQWKDLYVDGTANIDSANIDSASIGIANIPSASIGTASIGIASIDRLNLGNTLSRISGSLLPHINNVSDLGSSELQFKNLFLDGTASMDGADIQGLGFIHTASIGEVTSSLIPSVDDAVDLGSSTKQWKDLYVDGTANLDNVSIVQVTSNLIPSNSNNVDLGSSTKQWKDLYVDGVAYIDTIDDGPLIIGPTIIGTGSINATHITASNLLVSGTCNFKSSVLASVDAAHLGSADGFSKFSVQGQLQAALADGATSAEFTVGNTNIDLGDVIFGTVHGALMGGLSQSNMIITTRTANSMSFVFNNESGLVAVDDSAFTASFAIIK